MLTRLRNSDFFPYESYRNEQQQIINQIEDAIRKKKGVLLNAPNGTGKTIIALSALLPVVYQYKLKLIYMCRTHAQSTRVIRELQAIQNFTSYIISGLSIRGRNEMCLHSTLLRLKVSPAEAMSVCKDLRKNGNCKYYRNLRTSLKEFKDLDLFQFDKPTDAQHLIKFCKEKHYCPYFLSKYLLKDMQVVICNYQWVFNPDIKYRFFTLLDTELNKCILVIDECHNIINVATQVNSDKLTPYLVDTCSKDFIKYELPEKYVQFGRFLLNTLNQKEKDLPL